MAKLVRALDCGGRVQIEMGEAALVLDVEDGNLDGWAVRVTPSDLQALRDLIHAALQPGTVTCGACGVARDQHGDEHAFVISSRTGWRRDHPRD